MKHLTPMEASRLMFALLQKVRTSTGGGAQFSLATATTLFAALKSPGELQYDLLKEVGGVDASVFSRQLDLLDGNGRSKAAGSMTPLLRRTRAATSRVNNVIEPTPEGEQFLREFTDEVNKLLARHGAENA